MKIKLLKKYNKLLALLLSLLGFTTACFIIGGAEYGTPHADFIVRGKVVSEKDSRPIKNIRVIMRDSTSIYYRDSINTDMNGIFTLKITGFPMSKNFNIDLKDIDGTANGEFLNLDTIVKFTNPVFTGGNKHWYNGQTEKEFDLKMKPKL